MSSSLACAGYGHTRCDGGYATLVGGRGAGNDALHVARCECECHAESSQSGTPATEEYAAQQRCGHGNVPATCVPCEDGHQSWER